MGMNIKGKCVDKQCPRFGVEETYTAMLLAGLGAGKDRVKCPACGKLLQTTATVNTAGRPHVRPGARCPNRDRARSRERGRR